MKGFILAAGLGTRLLPITRYVPKALVPLIDRPLADYGLEILKQAGSGDIGVNAHHLASQIRAYGKSKQLTVFEEPEILGTGGYLRALGAFFNQDMLVVNGDVLLLGDEEFASRLIHRHLTGHNLVTLLVMRRPDFLEATGIDAEHGHVTGFGSGEFFFTGCQMVSPEILPMVKDLSIVPVYRKLIEAGKLGAEIFRGTWFDCGSRAGLLAAHRHVTGQESFIYPGAMVESGAVIQNSVVYGEGIVRTGGVLTNSILFRGEIESGLSAEGGILA